jgi:hypothetical protein
MWNKYDMTPSVAINATQLITIEAATVRQWVNTGLQCTHTIFVSAILEHSSQTPWFVAHTFFNAVL